MGESSKHCSGRDMKTFLILFLAGVIIAYPNFPVMSKKMMSNQITGPGDYDWTDYLENVIEHPSDPMQQNLQNDLVGALNFLWKFAKVVRNRSESCELREMF